MSLESTTNAIEDHLIDSISFKLQPGAAYVTDRRSVSFFPQGSNIYKPETGTKVIKIALTGTGEWLHPSTVQLQFQLKNEENNKMWVVGGPHSFIRRARLMCGGTVVEDIDQYNRIHEMMSVLSGDKKRDMDDISGSVNRYSTVKASQILKCPSRHFFQTPCMKENYFPGEKTLKNSTFLILCFLKSGLNRFY